MNAKTPMLDPATMDQLSTLAWRLAHNDKTREHFALIVNAVDPTFAKAAFGDVVVKRQLDAFRREIAEERQKDQLAKVAEDNERQKEATIKKYGYSPDQVAKLDEIRTQYGLSNWDAAARIYSTYNPPENPNLKPPPPEYLDGSTWEFPTVPGPDGQMLSFKDYIKDPRKYSNRTAWNMISDFKRGALPSAFNT